jgi:hypothetical protein
MVIVVVRGVESLICNELVDTMICDYQFASVKNKIVC